MNIRSLKQALGIFGLLLSLQSVGWSQVDPKTNPPEVPPAQEVRVVEQQQKQPEAAARATAESVDKAPQAPEQEPKTARRKDLTPVIHFRDF
jgi:hypothetical protein